jgi:integrase
MSVFKRGNRWRYDFWVNGKRYRGSIPEARVKAQAERAETKIRDQVYEGKYGREVKTPILEEFIKQTYLPWARLNKRSWMHDEFRSRPLIKALGKKRMSEISQILIERYKRDRREATSRRGKPMSPASVNRELELLSGILEQGLLVVNPCSRVKRFDEDNARNRYLSPEEEARLLPFLSGQSAHLRPIVLLAINTGMRKSELLSLRWPNVDFARSIIHIMNSQRERTKGKRSRSVPMNGVAREVLFSLHARQTAAGLTSEHVFGKPKTGKPYGDIKRAFASACRKAKVEDFCFHDLRRTAATRLGDLGANAYQIAAILGHADIKTSQIYTQATDEGLRRLMKALKYGTDTVFPQQWTSGPCWPL